MMKRSDKHLTNFPTSKKNENSKNETLQQSENKNKKNDLHVTLTEMDFQCTTFADSL